MNSVVFSPNGRLLATASYDEYLACPEPGISESKPDLPAGRLVQLWDIETGKQLPLVAGHTRQVTGLAFTSDGSHLISVSCDGTILTRSVDDGTLESSIQNIELKPIRQSQSILAIKAFSQEEMMRSCKPGRVWTIY
ncbi:MAG: hypothetical protein IPF85_11550 [Anaerolineae bacterium]|nr:hypothetical protein [Anaerolineae bacterium]